MRSIVFCDVEASGLYDGSWPIEVGWAIVDTDGRISSEAMLMRPKPDWASWSAEAEQVHGISREMLADEGRSASDVVARLDAVLGDRVVLSDYPPADAVRTDKLFSAAGALRRFRIVDADVILNSIPTSMDDHQWLAAHLDASRLHRADADACVLAEAYVELMRRREARG